MKTLNINLLSGLIITVFLLFLKTSNNLNLFKNFKEKINTIYFLKT